MSKYMKGDYLNNMSTALSNFHNPWKYTRTLCATVLVAVKCRKYSTFLKFDFNNLHFCDTGIDGLTRLNRSKLSLDSNHIWT